jgi:glutamine synthetase
MFKTYKDLFDYSIKNKVEFIDLRFIDLPGSMQHFNIPLKEFIDSKGEKGVLFDGSSVNGFAQINESDMKLIPDSTSAYEDIFRTHKTIIMNCRVVNPKTNKDYLRDPRNVAFRAQQALIKSGVADIAYFAPEAEFYMFDEVRFAVNSHKSFVEIDSIEGHWNTEKRESGGNLANKPQNKEGYFAVPPLDHFADVRDEIMVNLQKAGLTVERGHHEVGSASQQEIAIRFNELVKSADDLMKFKYIVKNTAKKNGLTVTFLPKPIFGDNGSGMHCHQSLWKDNKPLFWNKNPKSYAHLSDIARWYIGGLLRHSPSLLAFTNPSTNSYHRLIPGYEAPTNLVYSSGNRSACIRIPVTGNNPNAKRIEYRVPDTSCNPYLAFSAQLLAGLDGILNKIEPQRPEDRDLFEMNRTERKHIRQVPTSLEEVLNNVEKHHNFLLYKDVFTEDLIATWVKYKRNEVNQVRQAPNPYEFLLYYDV